MSDRDSAPPLACDPTALWEAVCRTSDDYIVLIDRAGTIRFCSRINEGFTPDQVIGRGMADFTVPEAMPQLVKTIAEVFATGQQRAIETTVRRLDGGLTYFALRLGPVERAGRIEAVLVCCENILPLKTSERALEHERTLLHRLLDIQEQERRLVSYEIHDGLAQYVAGALMHLEAHRHAHPEVGEDADLGEGLRLVRAAADEARRLISGLRPPALDELGLAAAIESLVAEARADIPEVSFVHAMPGPRLPPHQETAVFRLVQESLSNVRKHAAATKASIRIEQRGDTLWLRVRDDGRGFDPAAVPADRFGLEGIRQRCRLLGGEPRFDSRPGQGTTIEVTLPLQPASGTPTTAD